MSRITGGIFGRVAGKTSDIVFSQARGRRGTVNTARQLVIPANPRTPAQTANRSLFTSVVDSVRQVGIPSIRGPFNRLVGQLPAYQSFLSLAMTQITEGNLTAWPAVRLGPIAAVGFDSAIVYDGTDLQVEIDAQAAAGDPTNKVEAALLLFETSTGRYVGGAYDTINAVGSGEGLLLDFGAVPGITPSPSYQAVVIVVVTSSDGIIRGTTASTANVLSSAS